MFPIRDCVEVGKNLLAKLYPFTQVKGCWLCSEKAICRDQRYLHELPCGFLARSLSKCSRLSRAPSTAIRVEWTVVRSSWDSMPGPLKDVNCFFASIFLKAGDLLECTISAGQVPGRKRMRGTPTPVSSDDDPEKRDP